MAVVLVFAMLRYVAYMASALLFGMSVMLALAKPDMFSKPQQLALRRALQRIAVLGVVAVLGLLPLQAMRIADDWRVLMQPDVMRIVAWQTQYGQAWLLRVMGVLIVLGVLVFTSFERSRLRVWVTGLAILPLSVTGHAVMREGWLGVAHRVSDALHALAASFWLGALPVLLLLLSLWRHPSHRVQATRVLLRFSSVGHLVVAVLLGSGLFNAAAILWPNGLQAFTAYLGLLLIKVVLGLSMVAGAMVNRYLWVPKLRTEEERGLRAIRRNTLLMFGGATAIVLVVSVLGLLSPV